MNPQSPLTDSSTLAQRAARVRASGFNGIDFIEVQRDRHGHATRIVDVHLFHPAPERIVPANIRIGGGVRVQGLRVVGLRIGRPGGAVGDADLQLELDRRGDLSDYRLEFVEIDDAGVPLDQAMAGFDPWFSAAHLSFRAEGPSAQDCRPAAPGPAPDPVLAAPVINYLTKDYGGFRQLILDRMAQTLPGWAETHVPDIGITLVELLAYAGDYLGYYQDAVATEAYLATARQRISVRRHLRLVDYRMHDGCNARTWLLLETDEPDADWRLDGDALMFLGGAETLSAAAIESLRHGVMPRAVPAAVDVFEPVGPTPVRVRASHQAIAFHTWGGAQRTLPAGATRATLRDAWGAAGAPGRKLDLRPGDFLCFEQRGGDAMPVDTGLRHLVRLRQVYKTQDALCDPPEPVVEITWDAADALPFEMVLAAPGSAPGCIPLTDLWVAHGNVVLADEGLRIIDESLGPVAASAPREACLCEGQSQALPVAAQLFQPTLQQAALVCSTPAGEHAAASGLLQQSVRQALPWLRLHSIPGAHDGSGPLFSFAELRQADALLARLCKPAAQQDWWLRARLTLATRAALSALAPAAALPDALRTQLLQELQALVRPWSVKDDLLASGAQDAHVVAERDDQGFVTLRFGDGTSGRAPEAGELFCASYRVALASPGLLGADADLQVLLRGDAPPPGSLSARNPLPASGEIAPQTLDEARLLGTQAAGAQIESALDADDYAALAAAHPGVQRATAALLWTGSGHEVRVTIDPLGSERMRPQLLRAVKRELDARRRIGHEVVVGPATYVPLDLQLRIDIQAGHSRSHTEHAVREALDARRPAGIFHPDRLTFGQSIESGRIQAALLALPGVAAVEIRRLARLFGTPEQAMVDGVLVIGPREVAQLDNRLGNPERGRLHIEFRGAA